MIDACDERLADLLDRARVGHVRGVVDLELLAVRQRHVELHRGHRRQQLEVVLALQALAHDVHVQQAEKAAAKAEAERVRGLRLPRQRRVVEHQLLERVAQVRVVVGVDREQPAEHHRLDLAVARQRLARFPARGAAARARGPRARRQRVADAQQRDVLQARDQVADLARRELVGRHHLRAEHADVVDVRLRAGRHRANRLALAEDAVDDPDVGDHAAVLVELRVEDQRARRPVRVARRRRHARDQLLQHLAHALARLAADLQDRLRRLADQLAHFARDALGLRARAGRSCSGTGSARAPIRPPDRCSRPSAPRRPAPRRRPAARPRTPPASARPRR